MRRRTLIGSLSLSLALAGALIAVGVAAASRRSNERLAERTASRLLEEVPLPEGAKRVSSDESVDAGLKGPATKPATPHLLDKHRYWHVDGQGEAVISWIEEHPPAGSKIALRGSSGKPTGQPPRSLHGPALAEWVRQHTVTTGWDTTFAFSEQRERLATVWLSVSVAAAKGGGSEIRADALVVPRRPRPAAEHIPRRVGEVTVKVNDPRRHLRFTRQIGNRRKVKAIVATIEGLQRPEGGARSCPADTGKAAVIDMLFRKRKGTPPLVRVRIDDNGCGSVSFRRRGRQQPTLGEAYEAVKRLHHILKRTR